MTKETIKTVYKISDDGGRFVIVEKFYNSDKIDVLNKHMYSKNGEFIFKGSKPKTIKAMGKLLIEASNV